jgi:pimeloyl-ACP methyl ester carboxylesterase
MAEFLLVHGSWQATWCWSEIVPRLQARGHNVIAIDLPGHGRDSSPPQNVLFQDYVTAVARALSASGNPKILVGHSMSGAVINECAGIMPDSVLALVYVAALIPDPGSSMISFVEGFDPEYLAGIRWAPDRLTATLEPEAARRFLFSRCPPGAVEAALPLIGPEPVVPYQTPITFDSAKLTWLPRYYIECLQDGIVPLALQRATHAAARVDRVFSIDTDHVPFLSAPDEFVGILHGIAETL